MSQDPQTAPEPAWIAPRTAEEVAAVLRAAADARQSVVIRGGGTKSGWGRPAGRVDTVLDMRGLNRILEHQHGDMTATVESGATLREVNEALARHGQQLPLDPPFAEAATIGGILATNDSGPLRHRYGTPRDLVIGIQLATTDGVLSKAGGRVVKNVAGYDLSKLMAGSFGSLAAIVSATFKLSPLPGASRTLTLQAADPESLAEIVRLVMSSQLEPIAFEVASQLSAGGQGAASTVLLRFASLPAVVDAQIESAAALVGGCATSTAVVEEDAEGALWRDHSQRVWNADGAIVRLAWLPARIGDAIRIVRSGSIENADLAGRAALGAGLLRIGGSDESQARAIEHLRRSSEVGNVVIVRGSAAVKGLVDAWGPQGDRQPLFDALKRALDPHNILNAGRGPL